MKIVAINEYNVLDYGAVGDGVVDDAQAIQLAMDDCEKNGGGTVLFTGEKTYMTGPFDIKSNVQLRVERGTKVLANPDETVYTKSAFRKNLGEGTVWIGGNDIENVTITGGGIIDGNGVSFMGRELHDSYELKPFDVIDPRPHLLTLVGGKNIKVKDITFKDAAYWGLHFVGCENVEISGTTILNDLKIRNGDGIDLDHCSNIRISDCYIESGDDSICLKNRREYAEFGPCENIVISGCTMISAACAFKIGSENMDRICNVVVSNCFIKNSNRGIGIQNRDEGTVENITFSDITMSCRMYSEVWWGKAEPIYITAFKRASNDHKDAGWRLPEGQADGEVGKIWNIYFANIKCQSENGIYICGESNDKISNVFFSQLELEISKSTEYEGGKYDRRPCADTEIVEETISGFFIDTVGKVSVKESKVTWGKKIEPYYGYVLCSKNVHIVETSNLKGQSAFPEVIDPFSINENMKIVKNT